MGSSQNTQSIFVFVLLFQSGCFVFNVAAFSMIKKYDAEDYLSPQQLKDLMDFEYGGEPMEEIPEKRQNQGGTCTCTCETRPVASESKPRPQFPDSAVLMRTGVGTKPESANWVMDKQQQPSKVDQGKVSKAEAKVHQQNPFGSSDLNSIVHLDSMDYSNKFNQEPANDEQFHEEEQEEEMPEKVEITTAAPHTKADQSGQPDVWGHDSRFPWKRLPDTMCFRESCKSDKECCLRYNLCDKSAKVCVDCWYGSSCTSERDCCQRFPYCQRVWKKNQANGLEYVASGKCVSNVSKL